MKECPHGIVAGVCNFCLADQLVVEQRAIEEIRVAVRLKEDRAKEG